MLNSIRQIMPLVTVPALAVALALVFFLGRDGGYSKGVVTGYRAGVETVLTENAANDLAGHVESMRAAAPEMVKGMCDGFIKDRSAAGCHSLPSAKAPAESNDAAERLRSESCKRAITKLTAACGV
jgi:hypothetical protein